MSDTLAKDFSAKKIDRTKVRVRRPRSNEIDDFRAWLEALGFQSAPTVHVNGAAHPTAMVTVDFGTPLNESTKLSPEQTAELISYVRIATRSLLRDRETNVRVHNDASAGIWWSSVG